MAIYVFHRGQIIEKDARPVTVTARSDLPCPALHPFDSYPSPIDDATISSNRQRDRDLYKSDSYDPRDTPAEFKRAKDARRKANKRIAKPA